MRRSGSRTAARRRLDLAVMGAGPSKSFNSLDFLTYFLRPGAGAKARAPRVTLGDRLISPTCSLKHHARAALTSPRPAVPCARDSRRLAETGNARRLNAATHNLDLKAAADTGSGVDAAMLHQIVGALPEFVFLFDRSLRLLYANRGVAGRTAEGLRGMHLTELFPQHLHAVALATVHRVLATAKIDGYLAEIESDDGQAQHFDVRVTPVLRDEQVEALTLIATETTGQVRAERAIATQAQMIESMLEGVAVINERGVIEITNPAFDSLFAYRRGELIGREMVSLAGWPFEQRERWETQGTQSTESMRVEFDGRRSDGSHFSAAGVLSRFEVAGRNHSLVVLQDVSERKQLERAILQAVNREQYRIGNDLHDGLGQELTGIALMLRGVAGRLASEYPPIFPEIEGITRLVNNAIESTRALARGLSPVNLERGGLQDALEGLAMHATDLYGVEVACSHRVKTSKPLGAELANHLYRIAQEAVRNAVRHGQARSIRLHLHGARAKVRLTITDDGTGMPEDAMDASGMGLKTMQYRARMLGGEVRFETATPTGVRIICECPLEAPGDTARAPSKARRKKSSITASTQRSTR
jgi:PAS domain S-box-containing protein